MEPQKKSGIIYGPEFHDNWVDGTYRGFRNIGVDVSVLHCNQPINSNPVEPGSKRTNFLAVIKAWVQRMDRMKVLKRAVYLLGDIRLLLRGVFKKELHPSAAVFVVYVWITPRALWVVWFFHWIGIRQYFWAGDPPSEHPEFWPLFPYLDKIGMVDSDWKLLPEYKDKFEVLPFGGDEKLFRPIKVESVDQRFRADVSFVGLFSKERGDMLSAVKNVDLKIYGYGWDGAEETFGFSPGTIRGPVSTQDVNEIFCGSKISIGTLYTGMTSRRLFDIVAAGGFQISEYRNITQGLFEGAIPLFRNTEEMVNLIGRYLKDDKGREELAAEAHEIFLRRHTFAVRAKSILSSLAL